MKRFEVRQVSPNNWAVVNVHTNNFVDVYYSEEDAQVRMNQVQQAYGKGE